MPSVSIRLLRRGIYFIVALSVFPLVFVVSSRHHPSSLILSPLPPLEPPSGFSFVNLRRKPTASKYAFCSFLATREEEKQDEEDVYFIGIRMLIYQLLHDPETRTNTSIPFVVMVTSEVSQEKRNRLAADGAIVVEVSEININWIKPGRTRWAHVMDKLHVFELVQYEKVLLMDSDIVVVKRLDAIFRDPATELSQNRGLTSGIRTDEPNQPETYIMAGNSGPHDVDHPYPAPRGTRINAGFVVFKPSLEMFNYYMSIAAIEGRFPGGSPEQDLWNYVHERSGNMPWKQLNPDWTINSPIYADYEHGVATFHEKYWGCARDRRLRDVLLRSRWKMEGYWGARQKASLHWI